MRRAGRHLYLRLRLAGVQRPIAWIACDQLEVARFGLDVQRFLNIRDGCLGKSFADLGYQSILNLLVQYRADLAQGLWIGDQDQRREVSAVGTAIEFFCQLFGECGLVSLLV